ncbi:hypothetical protein [Myxococcus sp. AB025B]|uniref:hypothetical protein n=1 Tax=Myxococcus sp. AB025B TaxID=2562794 RepID=UPI001E457225|nr:hypothetical protein [Myxococcus sp. AB025B]
MTDSNLGLQDFHYPRQYTACIPDSQLLGGNGTVDPGEQCDDGNLNSQDGCGACCQLELF